MKLKNYWKRFWTLDRHHAAGFTLVELIVVIAILAILAGVAIPVYSGYIKKANEAADAQLLAAVNHAYAAACAENGENPAGLDSTKAKMPLTADLKVNVEAVMPVAVKGSFATYFAGNEVSAFKTYSALYFDKTIGAFAPVESNSAYAGLLDLLADADKSALLASIFMNEEVGLGIDGLLDKVNDVAGFAAVVDSASLATVLNSPEFTLYTAGILGLDPSEEGFQDKVNAKFNTLVADMIAKNPGMTQEQAAQQLRANAAVLYAAENTSNMDISSVVTLLGTDGAKDRIKDNLAPDSGNTGLALSQAAIAYGMYTAYAYSTGSQELIASTSNPLAILNGLDDDNFQAYINDTSNRTDIQAYIDSMSMVSKVANDGTAVDELMVNGFNDPALAAILKQMIGG